MKDRKPRDPRKRVELNRADIEALLGPSIARYDAHVHQTARSPVAPPPAPPASEEAPSPETIRAYDGTRMHIDDIYHVHVDDGFYLDRLEPEEAGRLIKIIARAAKLHPEAIADFIDDLEQIFP